MKDRACHMTAIEAVPGRVVEAMLVRSRDPDLTSDGEDIGAASEIGRSLLGACPILIEEQPGRGDLLKVSISTCRIGRFHGGFVMMTSAPP
jgi:hypothetical protein